MNCKQGDLAIVISSDDPIFAHFIGRMVTCEEYIDKPNGIECMYSDYWSCPEIPYLYIADAVLMPIRPDEAAKEKTKELETI